MLAIRRDCDLGTLVKLGNQILRQADRHHLLVSRRRPTRRLRWRCVGAVIHHRSDQILFAKAASVGDGHGRVVGGVLCCGMS